MESLNMNVVRFRTPMSPFLNAEQRLHELEVYAGRESEQLAYLVWVYRKQFEQITARFAAMESTVEELLLHLTALESATATEAGEMEDNA